jgi:endonuclease/exonuclease/phosphatase family metal-dependent hydrolase
VRLTVTSYNIKFPDRNAPHSWEQRRPLMAEQLARLAPDVLAVQEAYFHQVRELCEDLSGRDSSGRDSSPGRRFDWGGMGREGGSHGEFAAVLFDADLLEPVEYDHFWLSDTPATVGSKTPSWGNFGNTRMATWVRFRTVAPDPVTGVRRELLVLNTHLDESSERARQYGVELIAARLVRGFEAGLPVVVCGDFNTPAGGVVHASLLERGGLRDAWTEAAKDGSTGPELASYAGWGDPEPGGERIDWVLLGGPVDVESISLDVHRDGDRWPSDHLPLTARLKVG